MLVENEKIGTVRGERSWLIWIFIKFRFFPLFLHKVWPLVVHRFLVRFCECGHFFLDSQCLFKKMFILVMKILTQKSNKITVDFQWTYCIIISNMQKFGGSNFHFKRFKRKKSISFKQKFSSFLFGVIQFDQYSVCVCVCVWQSDKVK